MLYFLINTKPILIRSKLAASIVEDTFAREAVENEGGEEETTGGYFYCYFYWYLYRRARKSFRFLALDLIRKTITRACVLETDVRIYIYISRVFINMTK